MFFPLSSTVGLSDSISDFSFSLSSTSGTNSSNIEDKEKEKPDIDTESLDQVKSLRLHGSLQARFLV